MGDFFFLSTGGLTVFSVSNVTAYSLSTVGKCGEDLDSGYKVGDELNPIL